MTIKRRDFIKNGALAAAAIGVAPAVINACASPAEKINVALIGCRGMGSANLASFLKEGNNVECVSLCDVDSLVLERAAAQVEEQTGKRPVATGDFRSILDDKDVDAVIVATPDHWHAVMSMMALDAGKHVFVEKPMAHSIEESYAMEAKAKKHPNLKIQVNMWQRSSRHWFEAADLVKSGVLGDVHLVKAWIYKGYNNSYSVCPDARAPDYVDYGMWRGPAPERPFNQNRFHYNFRWWWDYAGGAMTDWGVHLLDFAMLAMDAGTPLSVSPGGGIYYHEEGALETPDIQQAIYAYPTHTMIWECGLNPGIGPYGKQHGVAYIGHHGTLLLDRGGWELIPERNHAEGQPFFERRQQPEYGDGLDEHVKNFLDCIRKGGKLNAPVEVGAITTIVSQMGNIAYRAGKRIHWNNTTRRFAEEDANQLIKVSYRDKWRLPV